ncbi:hypothetical protein [Actinokineospora globicatena]|uniref:hypothetical protein n=1 Tax=Actinokineospora globicatena TaxID=103729 RepID=UPI0020A31E46|nr:hypothetical protein [Actinokineospora globicatena]MCP2302413.1 hypothetical protein [Actinokineospora globicatena]GLW75907.1 hypothetical protein Aglo01_03890 [Actinokineospora globicatena]GLW82745.1 hypothetical protein Aglo02_03860 [Actinokineospora globicatena]
MTMPEHEDDAAVRSIVEMKRSLTELKLDVLLRTSEPGSTTDINDMDAIVAEVAAGVEARRTRADGESASPPYQTWPVASTS